MYVETPTTVNADIRFSSAKSDAKASQHTYKGLPSFNTDIWSALKVNGRAWYIYRNTSMSDSAAPILMQRNLSTHIRLYHC